MTASTATTTIWEMPEFYHFDSSFFRPQEKKQLQNAYENFIMNTKYKSFDYDDSFDDEGSGKILLQSKIQLFQLFVRTQPVNIRSFSAFHQQYQRIFIERLFYLVLNNVELTHFSTFSVSSIISISKELERYQRATHKLVPNTNKLNTVVQFVLSFSSSSVSSFRLNNLFYLLLHDINDISGKLIDRMAELLRMYHSMTYGHTITKQYLITTIESVVRTASFANPLIYPLYENFLNSSYVYKNPLALTSSKKPASISLYTIIQNLSITLLGITLDDFENEDKYLSFTSEQCYHIRLTIRCLTYLFKRNHYQIEYPLCNLDKQIIVQLINLIIFDRKTYDNIKVLLTLYMKYVRGFAETKSKQLLHDLLMNRSFELHTIETARHFIESNCSRLKLISTEIQHFHDDLWLNTEQIRLLTHKLYSNSIYKEILLPFTCLNHTDERSINDILVYLDNKIEHECEQLIDVQDMKIKLSI